MFDTRRSDYAKELKKRREATGDGKLLTIDFLMFSFGCRWMERAVGWL